MNSLRIYRLLQIVAAVSLLIVIIASIVRWQGLGAPVAEKPHLLPTKIRFAVVYVRPTGDLQDVQFGEKSVLMLLNTLHRDSVTGECDPDPHRLLNYLRFQVPQGKWTLEMSGELVASSSGPFNWEKSQVLRDRKTPKGEMLQKENTVSDDLLENVIDAGIAEKPEYRTPSHNESVYMGSYHVSRLAYSLKSTQMGAGLYVQGAINRFVCRDGMRTDIKWPADVITNEPIGEDMGSGGGAGTVLMKNDRRWKFAGASGPGGMNTLVLPGSHLIFVYDGE